MAKPESMRHERADDARAFDPESDVFDDAYVENDDEEPAPIPRESGPQPRMGSSFARAARGSGMDGSALPGAALPREGGLIAGKYRVDGVQSRDSLAVTLRASHVELGQRVWVRYLLPRALRRPDSVTRFMRRARSVAALRSEHAARVLDVGRIRSGIPFVVLDDMNGWDLDEVIRVRGPLPVQEAVEYVLQTADALAEAHGLGIVHGSLRPSNILLARRIDDSPLIKVAGFEFSDLADEEALAEAGEGVSSRGFMATLPYRAPEQIRSSEYVDERADVWAIGATLHTLLTGAPPFRARTASALLAAVSADEPRRIGELRNDVAPDIEALILGCLAKNPGDRPLGMAEIAECLAPFAPGDSLRVLDRISKQLPTPSLRPPPLPPPPIRAIVPVPRPRTVAPAPKPAAVPPQNQLVATGLVALAASMIGAAMMLIVARAVDRDRDEGRAQPAAVQQAPTAAVQAPAAPAALEAAPAAAPAPARVQSPPNPARAAVPATPRQEAPRVAAVPASTSQPTSSPRAEANRAARTGASEVVARSEPRSPAHDDTKTAPPKDLFDDTR